MKYGSTGTNKWLTYVTDKLTGFAYFISSLKLVFGQTLVQTKALSTTPTSDTDTAWDSIAFNNLVVGNWYRVDVSFMTEESNFGGFTVLGYNGGTTIFDIFCRAQQFSGSYILGQFNKTTDYVIFQATDTNITFQGSNVSANRGPVGNGTTVRSKVTLQLLPNHEATNKFD